MTGVLIAFGRGIGDAASIMFTTGYTERIPTSVFDAAASLPLAIFFLLNSPQEEVRQKAYASAVILLLKDRLNSPASQLSIGQQRGYALQEVLLLNLRSILCDEPTSALDPVSSQHIEQQLLKLKKDYTIVIVTHNIHQAMRLADYVIHLYLGELVEHGDAKTVFENPKEERTRAYINGTFQTEPKVRKKE